MSPTVKALLVGAAAAGLASLAVDKFINPLVGDKVPDFARPFIPAAAGALIALGVSKAL